MSETINFDEDSMKNILDSLDEIEYVPKGVKNVCFTIMDSMFSNPEIYNKIYGKFLKGNHFRLIIGSEFFNTTISDIIVSDTNITDKEKEQITEIINAFIKRYIQSMKLNDFLNDVKEGEDINIALNILAKSKNGFYKCFYNFLNKLVKAKSKK